MQSDHVVMCGRELGRRAYGSYGKCMAVSQDARIFACFFTMFWRRAPVFEYRGM